MTINLPFWLNPYQLIAWVRYRDPAIVMKATNWQGLSSLTLYEEYPHFGSVVDIERALQEGQIIAQGQRPDEAFAPIHPVEWMRIALGPLDLSKQQPYANIQFKREHILAIFPPIASDPSEMAPPRIARKRPGPAPHPDWPNAIAKVIQDCIAAGYTRPLKRGGKAAIQTMLLSYMADKDKHFSDDIAAKHAKAVIAALPDN